MTVVGAVRAGRIAFDTGPANALIDAAVAHVSDGAETLRPRRRHRPARARPRATCSTACSAEPYYAGPPPKTTGKELFHLPYLFERAGDGARDRRRGPGRHRDRSDRAHRRRRLPGRSASRRLVVSGGGAENPTLMEMLAAELPGAPIIAIDELGVPAAAKEAYFFALIGFSPCTGSLATCRRRPGRASPAVLGCVLPGREGFPRCDRR